MNKIKFSHKYYKIPDGALAAMLTDIIIVNLEDLSPKFIQYDTAYWDDGEVGVKSYPLPKKGKYMMLMLVSRLTLFTTLRRWTPQKEKYYRSLIGQEVEIVIEEEKG